MPNQNNIPSETNFIDTLTAARLTTLDQADMTAGMIPVSIECGQEFQAEDLHAWVEHNTELFLFLIDELERFEQDLLLSYYMLRKSQEAIARIFNLTQTNVSKKIADAIHRLTLVITGHDAYPRKPVEPRAFPDYFVDPICLGQFRVDVTDPGFDKFFTQSANPQRTVRACGATSIKEDR